MHSCTPECGGSEGSWLVRESISSPGDYVLTVVMDGQPQHILVHRHTSDDAVFSLSEWFSARFIAVIFTYLINAIINWPSIF